MNNDLILQDIIVSFTGTDSVATEVVKGVSLTCREGAITGLIGETGSGKSVLGMSILSLLPANADTGGHIFYQDRDLLSCTEDELRELRGRTISFIPQNPDTAFDPMQVVGTQIGEPLIESGQGKGAVRQCVDMRLGELGFSNPTEIAKAYSYSLSGGMCQRALCALGTIGKPSWLVADEPTKGLDLVLRKQVVHIFRRLRQEGLSILLITHDLDVAENLCDYIGVMKDGSLVEFDAAETVFNRPASLYTQTLLAARPQELLKRRKGWSD